MPASCTKPYTHFLPYSEFSSSHQKISITCDVIKDRGHLAGLGKKRGPPQHLVKTDPVPLSTFFQMSRRSEVELKGHRHRSSEGRALDSK